MDTFIHCIESLGGNYRNSIADAMSNQALRICNDVFLSDAPQSEENREKLMAASFLGGSAIGGSLVGIVHPLSAGLSVVLGTPHCLANCIVMRQMEEFYPAEYKKFMIMIEKNSIEIPENLCASLDESQFSALYDASIVHEKPLTNALGKNFKQTLTPKKLEKYTKECNMPGHELINHEEKKWVNKVFENGGVLFRHGFENRRQNSYMVKNFEVNFAEAIGTNYALAVTSGTAALRVALASLNLPKIPK